MSIFDTNDLLTSFKKRTLVNYLIIIANIESMNHDVRNVGKLAIT